MGSFESIRFAAATTAGQKALLMAALRDRKLQETVPAVVAVGFGVLPLGRIGDELLLAGRPGTPAEALEARRRLL